MLFDALCHASVLNLVSAVASEVGLAVLNSADSVGAARERIAQTGACGLLGETEISPPRCRDAISLMV